MPCSQMISMNISPPRATADRNVDSVPNVNARILNSGSRNIGCGDALLDGHERDSEAIDAAPAAPSTRALPQPVACPPAGRMP